MTASATNMDQLERFGAARRSEFPLLKKSAVVFLDSAASAQKPSSVINAMTEFMETNYANVHRGVYRLSQNATEHYEGVRAKVQKFLSAQSEREIIFTRGTTEGINLVAHSFGRKFLAAGDEILLTVAEHHSNIVPWQQLAEERGVKLVFAGLDSECRVTAAEIRSKLSPKTKLVCFTALANGLGLALPASEIIAAAKSVGATVLIDGAQIVSHEPVNVTELGCDFFAFSGHKLYGPTGIGVLWGREELLNSMPPFLGGGDMIRAVTVGGTTYNDLPYKFEAGTPPIVEVIGLGAAIDYLEGIGFSAIQDHERGLTAVLEESLSAIPGLRTFGRVGEHRGLVTFVMECAHPHDVSQFLDSKGIAVRAGHHCAQPLMHVLGEGATIRASLGIYNSPSDIAQLRDALLEANEFFRI